MMINRESPRFTNSELVETAAAKLSNHSLAVAGRSLMSLANAAMTEASSCALTSERKLDNAGGACVSFCAIS